jgi:hypothetical protein
MNCQQCGDKHDKKGLYCSKRCCDKAYRDRKKAGAPVITKKIVAPKEVKTPEFPIPKEKGPKLKWCMCCGNSLEHSSKLRYCNDAHERMYWETVNSGNSLKISIDSRTTIVTRKYDKIQEIIETMLSRQSFNIILA